MINLRVMPGHGNQSLQNTAGDARSIAPVKIARTSRTPDAMHKLPYAC
jgi:hypothetical protein